MNTSFGELEAILEHVPPHPEHLIRALHEVQAKFNYIPADALDAVCDHVGVARSQGWAVATFYKAFSLRPRKEHEISVCVGTACHIRGAAEVYETIVRGTRAHAGEESTPESDLSVEKVYCLGCCSMGPVAKVGNEIHANLDQKKVDTLIQTHSKR
ncbi:MAG: NAD(P)H-dependent oxidoreductase subunit E [Syntrophobacter sp.]